MKTLQFDLEEPSWDPLMRDCDLAHMRLLFGSIQTDLWPYVYKRTLEYGSTTIVDNLILTSP